MRMRGEVVTKTSDSESRVMIRFTAPPQFDMYHALMYDNFGATVGLSESTMKKLLTLLLGRGSTPRSLTFRYKYLRHPFDNTQHFSVQAADQATADKLAIERFAGMLKTRQTVMTEFWPA